MIRRHVVTALAVVALGFAVTAPAQAGGTGGAVGVKKTANIKIKNTTGTAYYVVVVPPGFDDPNTPKQAKRLGAYLLNPGKTVVYPVPNGNGEIGIIEADQVPPGQNDPLPSPDATQGYGVKRGGWVYAKIVGGPSINLVPKF